MIYTGAPTALPRLRSRLLHSAIPPSPTWSLKVSSSEIAAFSPAEFSRLSRLCGLQLSDGDIPKYTDAVNQLRRIVAPIRDIDTANVVPLKSMTRPHSAVASSGRAESLTSMPTAIEDAPPQEGSGRALLQHSSAVDGSYYVARRMNAPLAE